MTTKEEAPEAAAVAHAMSECMNLLFLFAAPRILASVRAGGQGGLDGAAALASLRRFLRQANGIRARADSKSGVTGDVARLVESAMIVEEIAGALDAAHFQEPLPGPVVDRARRALAILGAAEPKGGWDAFEGFSVPLPPPKD
jgi:hypothetical protein